MVKVLPILLPGLFNVANYQHAAGQDDQSDNDDIQNHDPLNRQLLLEVTGLKVMGIPFLVQDSLPFRQHWFCIVKHLYDRVRSLTQD